MKPIKLLTSVLAVIICGTGCDFEHNTTPQKQEQDISDNKFFTIDEAKNDFDNYPYIQNGVRLPVLKAGFDFGQIEIDWDNFKMYNSDAQYYIEAPIDTQYEYLVGVDGITVRTYCNYLSTKDRSPHPINSYIKIFIPSADYAHSHGMSDMRSIINVGKQDDFSGIIIYTDLSGLPLYVSYIEDGYKIIEATIYQPTHTIWENCMAINHVLRNCTFYRRLVDRTRSDDNTIIASNRYGIQEQPTDTRGLYDSFMLWQSKPHQ